MNEVKYLFITLSTIHIYSSLNCPFIGFLIFPVSYCLVKSVKMHPIYKKRFVVRKKYFAHNAENKAQVGNTVKIRLVKPISKMKKWNIIEVL